MASARRVLGRRGALLDFGFEGALVEAGGQRDGGGGVAGDFGVVPMDGDAFAALVEGDLQLSGPILTVTET
jgi:hypothetical protein